MNAIASEPPENFVLITGGTFEMGSPDTEGWRSEDETQHTVTVSDFYMSPYEMTQAEYAEVMNDHPSSFSGDNLPVENISWLDAVAYCNARSELEGLKECGIFYLATINGNVPAARPFGAVSENDGDLFITAADTKAVYRQMKQNSNIQIVALKHGTREWIRINGNAEECADLAMK